MTFTPTEVSQAIRVLASLVLGFTVALAGLRTSSRCSTHHGPRNLPKPLPLQIDYFYIVDIGSPLRAPGGAAGIHPVVDALPAPSTPAEAIRRTPPIHRRNKTVVSRIGNTRHENLQSQAALHKLGAQHEGTFRNHYIMPDGTMRHSVWFSITKEDWPQVKT